MVAPILASCSIACALAGDPPGTSGFREDVDVASKLVTTLATILAGGWAYYRFVKGRVFEPFSTRSTIRASPVRAGQA